ncbi:MAG: 50S ribosomal protein L21 [Bdellovibrionales bacterium]|nr:50S ribosomal protein L21 [Bdellovibrionales bacterium]
MYAILKTGGKQYKVQAGDVIRVEKLMKDIGSEFDLTEVLCVSGDETYVGEPVLSNAKVTVVVTNQAKAPKVIVFKKKRRQGYRRLKGHRQLYTELFVKSITAPNGETVNADSKPHVFDPVKREERLKKIAEEKAADKKSAAKKPAAKKTATKKKTKRS